MAAPPFEVPALFTDRIVLEPLSWAHSEGMFSLWSSPEVCRHSGAAQDIRGDAISLPARTSADSDKILEFFVEASACGIAFRWALLKRESGKFLGAVGFNSVGAASEIAYHLHPQLWGNGFMTEASRLALNWLFQDTSHKCADAYIEADNLPSIRLAERLGFEQTAELKDGARLYRMRGTGQD